MLSSFIGFVISNNHQHNTLINRISNYMLLGVKNLPTMRTTSLRGELKSSQAYCSDS